MPTSFLPRAERGLASVSPCFPISTQSDASTYREPRWEELALDGRPSLRSASLLMAWYAGMLDAVLPKRSLPWVPHVPFYNAAKILGIGILRKSDARLLKLMIESPYRNQGIGCFFVGLLASVFLLSYQISWLRRTLQLALHNRFNSCISTKKRSYSWYRCCR